MKSIRAPGFAGMALVGLLSSCASSSALNESVEGNALDHYGEYGRVLSASLGAHRFVIDEQHRLLVDGEHRLTLPTDNLPYIYRAQFLAAAGTTMVIGYEMADADAVMSKIVALDRKTYRITWTERIPRANLGPMLLEGSRVYVSASGLIAALDTRTGRRVWTTHGRWDGRDVEAFEQPIMQGRTLIYREWTPYDRPARRFRVDKRDGETSLIGEP
jgi:hypothetical protein